MLKTFGQWIVGMSSKIETMELNGETYSRNNLIRIKRNAHHEPTPVDFSALQGLVDFLNHETLPEGSFLHVVNYSKVRLYGPLQADNENNRFLFASAQLLDNGFKFGDFIEVEKMAIGLQSMFVKNKQVDDVLNLLGKVATSNVTENQDSGFSQTVRVKIGIVTKENVEVTNPVTLTPYRTFREVKQPASAFILRFQKGHNDKLHAALFEGDGGVWKIEAMAIIKKWLEGKTSLPVIA